MKMDPIANNKEAHGTASAKGQDFIANVVNCRESRIIAIVRRIQQVADMCRAGGAK